ncbi:hypothetical protein M758_3G145100 [Ceratodon purpureus]|nr:hypothetical protein M758_3G145100 [Ceratodon purpureus]
MDKGGDAMNLTIKFGVTNIAISLPASSKVSDLMHQLQSATDILPRVQKLIFKGKVLTPDLTLKNAQLKDGSKIMLMAAQGFQSRFPVRSASPVKGKTSPPKSSITSKQIPLKPTEVEESRLKAWKLTGVVSLRDSGSQKVPAAVWSLQSAVRVLDLAGNCLSAFPSDIKGLTNLQRLRLWGNQLKSDSIDWKSLASLSQLSVLALDHNLLDTIPPEIGQLTSLKYFTASNNKLASIPEEIGNLRVLEKLDLSYNCLRDVPAGIGRCAQLSEINLTGNLLISIPASWSQMMFLKKLLLDSNQLKDFPPAILQKCAQLQTLSLHSNELTMDDLRELEGWSEFDKRRKDKYTKQIDMQVMGSTSGFDEGADTEQWQRW